MDIQQYTSPDKLERYSFLTLLSALGFSAIALFNGGYPIITMILGYSNSYSLLSIAWLVSGAAAVYLSYLYWKNNKKVFGGGDKKSELAFLFALLLGYNLGLTALIRENIFFNIFHGTILFVAFGVLCVVVGYILYTKWKSNDEKLFVVSSRVAVGNEPTNDEVTNISSMNQAQNNDDVATDNN